jgi:sec-independent protein translocase protein TatB
MFDVSFTEMLVIGVVALIVIGPERLPKVARTAGILLGRVQRYVRDVKSDISREMQLDELKKVQQQVADEAKSMETTVSQQMTSIETSLNDSIAQGIEDKAAAVKAPDVLPTAPIDAIADKPKT